ncbi:MAG TPA: methylenetetrahydrofolate reductase, partial [Candidatus Binatus sp.]|nr:methylenetetrahydrofolate reductase [Candidatus Binatus sp.]
MKLHELIGRRRIVTVELIPDRISPADLGLLRGRVDAVTVPALRNSSNDPVFPTGHHVSPQQRSIAAATLLRGTGLDAIPAVTCRDSSLNEITRLPDLLTNGIENLLVLYGDPHELPLVDRYEFKASHQLVDIVHQSTRGQFSLWGITNQYSHDREREVKRTWLREDAGARLVLTNAVFEPDGILEYRDALRSAGVSVPLSVQISVIHSPDNLSFVSQKLGIPVPESVKNRLRRDPEAGVDIAVDAYWGLRDEFDAVHFSYLYR